MRKKFQRYAGRLADKLNASQESDKQTRSSLTTETSKINGDVKSEVASKTKLKTSSNGCNGNSTTSPTKHHTNDDDRAKESHVSDKSIRKPEKSSCDKLAAKVLSPNPITSKKSATTSLPVAKKADGGVSTMPKKQTLSVHTPTTKRKNVSETKINTDTKTKLSNEVKQAIKIADATAAAVGIEEASATIVAPKTKSTPKVKPVRKRRSSPHHELPSATTDAVEPITIVHNMKLTETTKRRTSLAGEVIADKPKAMTTVAVAEVPERIGKVAANARTPSPLVTRLSTKETQTGTSSRDSSPQILRRTLTKPPTKETQTSSSSRDSSPQILRRTLTKPPTKEAQTISSSRDSSPQILRRTLTKLPTVSNGSSKRTIIELPAGKKETCPSVPMSPKRQQLSFEEAIIPPVTPRSRSSSASSVTPAKVTSAVKVTQPESPIHRKIEIPADAKMDPKMYCARVHLIRHDYSKLTFPMKRKFVEDCDDASSQPPLTDDSAAVSPKLTPKNVKRLKTKHVNAESDVFVMPAVPSNASTIATGTSSFTPKSILQSPKHLESNKLASPTEFLVSTKKTVKFCDIVEHVNGDLIKPVESVVPCQKVEEFDVKPVKMLAAIASETVEAVLIKTTESTDNGDSNKICATNESIPVHQQQPSESTDTDSNCDKKLVSKEKNVARRKRGRPKALMLTDLVQPVQLLHFPTMSSSGVSTFDQLPAPTIISAALSSAEHTLTALATANDDAATKSPECIFGSESPQFPSPTTVTPAKRKRRRTKKHASGDLKIIIRSSSESQSEIVPRKLKVKRRKAKEPKDLMHFRLKASAKPYQSYRDEYGEQMFNAMVILNKNDPIILEYFRRLEMEIKEETADLSEDDNKSTHSGGDGPDSMLPTTTTETPQIEQPNESHQQHETCDEQSLNGERTNVDSVETSDRSDAYQTAIDNAPNYYYPTEYMHISARNLIAAASNALGSGTPTYTSNAIESMYNAYMQPTPPYDSPSSGSGATTMHSMAPLYDTSSLMNIQPTPPYEPQATNIDGITILSNEVLPPVKLYPMPISRMHDSLEQSFSDDVYMSGVPETLQEIPAEEVLKFLSSQNDEAASNMLMSKNSVNDDIEMGMAHASKSMTDNVYFDRPMHVALAVQNNSPDASASPSLSRAVSMSSLLTGAVRTKASLKQMDDGFRMTGMTDDIYSMNMSMTRSGNAFSCSDESLSSKLISNENPLMNNGRGSNNSLDETTFAMCTSSNRSNNNNNCSSMSTSVQSSPIMQSLQDDAVAEKNGELGITFSTPTKQNPLQFDMEDSIIDEVLMNGDGVFMNGDEGQIEKYCLELANSQNILCERD